MLGCKIGKNKWGGLEKWWRDNKQGGSINRGGRTNLLQTIVGEALLRMSRVENWYELNKRGLPAY